MAEFAAAAIASIGSSIAAVGATGAEVAAGAGAAAGAATATTAAAGAAASSGGILSTLGSVGTWGAVLSGGASALSLMAAARAGDDGKANYFGQAADIKTDIGNENVKEQTQRNSIRASLLQAIGERDAAYAASGIDTSFGSPVAARDAATTDAETALTGVAAQTDSRIARLNEKAANLILMGKSAKRRGDTLAAATGLEGAGKILRRG